MTDAPSISVVVPAYRAARTLPACLAAVRASERALLEILVVLDGTADAEGADARLARSFGARVLTLPERSGPGAARNAGVEAARGDVAVFVDADVAPHPTAIGRLVDALSFGDGAGEGVVASFGSYDAAPPEKNLASQYKNLLHHYVHQQGREDAETFWAGLGAITRAAFRGAGGFDAARYPEPSIEDIELGRRLREGGARIRLVKDAQGTHMKRWSARGVFFTDTFRRARPWTELILRSGFLQRDLNLGFRHRAGVAATGLALACLAGSLLDARLLVLAGLFLVAAVASASDVLAFFARARGPVFALAAIPLHLSYFAASGLGFALGYLSIRARSSALR